MPVSTSNDLHERIGRVQFFTLDSSKIEVFETHFFDIVST